MTEMNRTDRRGTELAKNTFILSFGTILPRLSAFITLPIITSVVSKADLGTYDYMVTLVSLLVPVITLQIHSAAFRFLIDARGDVNSVSKIITNIYAFILPASILGTFLYYLLLYNYSFSSRVLLSLYLFFQLIFNANQQIVRGLSKNALFSVSSIAMSVVNVVFIVLFVYVQRFKLMGLLLSSTVSSIVGTLLLIIGGHTLKYCNFSLFSPPLIKEMLQYSWPIVPNSLSNWTLQISDRLVLTAFIGAEATAVYTVANRIPSLLNIIQSTFGFAWQENASVSLKDGDSSQYYSKIFDTFFSILSGGFAAVLAITPLLFSLLIRGDYNDAYYHIPVLLFALFFSAIASFMSGIYVAHKRTKSIGLTTVVAAVINLSIDFLMVLRYGIFAASISTLISYVFLAVYRMIDSYKFQPVQYHFLKIGLILTTLLIMCVFSFMQHRFLNHINLIIAVALNAMLNLDLFVSVIKIILRKLHVG